LRKNTTKVNTGTIYLRVTVNGKRAVSTTGGEVPNSVWNVNAGKALGTSSQAKLINRTFSKVEKDIMLLIKSFCIEENPFSRCIIYIYLGKDKEEKMLLDIFQEHNDRLNKLIGKNFAAGTAGRYRTAKKHFEDYIKKEYKASDIPVKNVYQKFISGLEYYLKTERNCAHNSAIKYITNFKKIIRILYANEWINRDPFNNWKGKLKIKKKLETKDQV
jgi:hypothetical protein